MANLKASKKDIRRIAKRTEKNRQVKSRVKTALKTVHSLAKNGGTAEELKTAAKSYVSALDKAIKRNILHQNKGDREKHKMSAYIFGGAPS